MRTVALAFLLACSSTEPIEPTPFSALSGAQPDIGLYADHGSGKEIGRGEHTMVVQVAFGAMHCERFDDDVRITINGLEPATYTPGPDTKDIAAGGAWTCRRGDEPVTSPGASSVMMPRDLDVPVVIELSQGDATRTITVQLPPVTPYPRIDRIEAIAPKALLPHADGFETPSGVPVIYPDVTYRVIMEGPWLPVEAQSSADLFVRRTFPDQSSPTVLLGGTFEGSEIAFRERSFALETLHYYDMSCTDADPSGCVTLDGFDQAIVSGYHLIEDITPQDPLVWAQLGEAEHLCRADGSCDEGLTCSADRVCELQ